MGKVAREGKACDLKKCSNFLNVQHHTLKLYRITNFDLFFSFLEIIS